MKTLFIIFSLLSIVLEDIPSKISKQNETIPIIGIRVLPLVKATLNGKEIYLLIDSGSTSTVLDIGSMRKMGFGTFGATGAQEVVGIGGKKKVSYVHSAKLYLGNIKINNSLIAVDLKDLIGYIKRKTSYRISGILGTDTMRTYNVIIDYGNEVCVIGMID